MRSEKLAVNFLHDSLPESRCHRSIFSPLTLMRVMLLAQVGQSSSCAWSHDAAVLCSPQDGYDSASPGVSQQLRHSHSQPLQKLAVPGLDDFLAGGDGCEADMGKDVSWPPAA